MKIVINTCYGGWELSKKANEFMEGKWIDGEDYHCNPKLIALIERVGSDEVSGRCADLRIVEIPDEATDYIIDEYDGWESVVYVLDGKLCNGRVIHGDDKAELHCGQD